MKKGFTLIELLAVIAILAILLVIAIPKILQLFENEKKKAFEVEAKNVLKAIEQGYASSIIKGNVEDTVYTYINSEVEKTGNISIYLSGKKIENGTINISSTGEISFKISDGKYCAVKSVESKEITIMEDIENCLSSQSSSFIEFVKNFGGTGTDRFYGIDLLEDGYIVVGESNSTDGDLTGLNRGGYDAIIIKYNLNGTIAWTKTFGGTKNDKFNKIVVTDDGYIVVGNSFSDDLDLVGLHYGITGNDDAIIVKYDTNGNVVWKKNYGGSSTEYFESITLDTDGYITVGTSYSSDYDLASLNKGSFDGIIVKYNLDGTVAWKKNFGGSTSDYMKNITTISDGYIVVGHSDSNTGNLSSLNKGSFDAFITKYNKLGTVIWTKTFGGSGNDYFYGIKSTTDGYIATGRSYSTDGNLTGLNMGNIDSSIVKYNLDGTVAWNKNFGGSDLDYFNEVISVLDGYYVSGYSKSTDGDLTGLNKGDYDAYVIKYNLNGSVTNKKHFGGNLLDYFYKVVSTNDGLISIGYSASTNEDLTGLNKGGYDAIIYAVKK